MEKSGTKRPGQVRQKILVIDENPSVRDVLEIELANAYEVVSESALSQALLAAEREHPHIILMGLEHQVSVETIGLFQKHPVLSSVPIIGMAAQEQEESRRQAIRMGVSGILEKPLKAISVADELRSLLKSLNVEVRSSDLSRVIQISFNSTEKISQIYHHIEREITLGRRVILLSPLVGRQFASRFENVKTWIDEGKLIYLEIKPLLPAKMEYMEDLSTILRDMEKIIELGARDCLMVDEPETLLLPQAGSPNAARIHAFERSVARVFEVAYYFCRRPNDSGLRQSVHTMAQALAGNL